MTSKHSLAFIVLVTLGVSQVGCATPQPTPEKSPETEKSPVKTIRKERAIEMALKALTDDGWQLEKYAVNVTDDGASWRVDVEPEGPAPPGSDASVIVRKTDGETTIHWGE